MRILITNDDGINAAGLAVLHRIASNIAGPQGEVWTVAPAFEQSGVGHCISYVHPFLIAEMGERRYACEGSPADCVLAGIHEVLADNPPDLILSGVNRGNNSAENAMYSGTLGAAIEGALQGLKAIALSQFYGPGNRDLDNQYEAAEQHGEALIRRLLDHGDWGVQGGYHTFYSLNFPPVAGADVKGARAVAQGARGAARFACEGQDTPNGRRFLWLKGPRQDIPGAPDTDVTVNLDGWISVTPMRCNLTAQDRLADLAAAIEG